MRLSTLLIAAAVSMAAAPAFAADVAAPATTTAPRVMVVPFNVLNVPESQQWIGQGVQESLIADLGRSGAVPVPFDGKVIVEDNATAVRLAKAAGATYVIRGVAQVVGNSVRVTAQVIEVRTGETVQTAVVTGGIMDLLNMEDDLAAQLRGKPAVDMATVSTPEATGGGAQTPVVQPAAPQIIVVSTPGPTVYTPAPSYVPDVPDYGYGYAADPFYYPGFPYFVTVVSPRHDRDHDRDCDDDGRNGRGGGHHDGSHDVNLGANGDGSGVFHLITKPTPSKNTTALPLATNSVLPIPTNNVQPLPINNVLPLMRNANLPTPEASVRSSPHMVAPTPVSAPPPAPSPSASGGTSIRAGRSR